MTNGAILDAPKDLTGTNLALSGTSSGIGTVVDRELDHGPFRRTGKVNGRRSSVFVSRFGAATPKLSIFEISAPLLISFSAG